MKFSDLYLLLSLALASCASTDEPEPGPVTGSEITLTADDVSIQADDVPASRSYNNSNFTKFHCWAFYGDATDAWYIDTDVTRHAPGNSCTFDNSHTFYWPKHTPLHFYALADEGGQVNAPWKDADGNVKSWYEVSGSSDLIYANKRNQWGAAMHLDFGHALCQVTVHLTNNMNHYEVGYFWGKFFNMKYKGNLQFPASESGGLNWSNADDDARMCHWVDVSDERKEYIVQSLNWGNGDNCIVVKPGESKQVTGTIYILPQQFNANQKYFCEWHLRETNYGSDVGSRPDRFGKFSMEAAVAPSDWTCYPNRAYRMYITFNDSSSAPMIKLVDLGIDGWGNGGNHWILGPYE